MASDIASATSPRPRIGVLVSQASLDLGPEVDAFVQTLTDRAVAAVEAAGGDVEVIDISAPQIDAASLTSRFDGLLVLGGADIDPAFYGQTPHPTVYGLDPAADQYEIDAVRDALGHGTPLVGICRGMQVMNVAAGGSLIQDLGADTLHHGPADALMISEEVQLQPESRLGGILQRPAIPVRSGHHQAVDQVANGFQVVARGQDGVVEAIEHAHTWAIGMQWHPEDPGADDEDFAMIARAFVAQAAARRGSLPQPVGG